VTVTDLVIALVAVFGGAGIGARATFLVYRGQYDAVSRVTLEAADVWSARVAELAEQVTRLTVENEQLRAGAK